MADKEVTIRFTSEGLEEILQRLQELEQELQRVNQQVFGGPAPSSSPPGAGAPGSPRGGAPPPPPPGSGASATQQATQAASSAAGIQFAGFTAQQSAGGWVITTPQGQQIPLGSWQDVRDFASAIGAQLPAAPPSGSGVATAAAATAAAAAGAASRIPADMQRFINNFSPALTSAALALAISAQYGGRAMVGEEIHWQDYVRDITVPLFATAGGVVGAFAGMPLVGAILGGFVGSVTQNLTGPQLQRGVMLDVLDDLRRITGLRLGFAAGNYDIGVINTILTGARAGMPLGRYWADVIQSLPAPLREPFGQAVVRYATDPVLFGLYGYGATTGTQSIPTMVGAALAAGDYTSPLITMLPIPGVREVAQFHARARAEAMLAQPRAEAAGAVFQAALQFGGTPAARTALPAYQGALGAMVAALRQQRAMSLHPLEQAQLDAQIQQLEIQMQLQLPGTIAQTRLGEIQAFGGERLTAAQIGLQTAQIYGMPVQMLPFGELTSAMRELAQELRRFLRENAPYLSPAQEASIRAQIAQMEFQAGPAMRAQMASMAIAQSGVEYTRTLAEFGAFTARAQILGPPAARYGIAAGQVAILANRVAQLRQLAVQPGVDYNTRQSLMAAAAQLEAQMQQLGIGAELGYIGEMGGAAATLWQLPSIQAQTALLQGVGGLEAMPLLQQMMGAATGQVGVAQWQLQALRAAGVSPLHPLFVQAQRQLATAQLGAEQMRLATAVVPMSAQMREQFSNVETALAIARTTFAGYADIRGLLSAEMQLIGRRIAEIQAMPPPETPAVRAARTEEINRLLLQAAGLQMQLEEGWLDRLISQVWNAPESFNLVASGFTRREASLFHGIAVRAFGGSREMSEYWRRQVPAFYASLIGRIGTPTGFMETAMMPARLEGNLNVRIIVEQPGQSPITRVEQVNLRDSNPIDYTLTPIMVRAGGMRQ